ncbi:MAG: hypothetical protein BWK80_00265 [Desulfobacteraceae bacterium IS3]|nr:MAG: hypothetical protein BWK80_00265 [Desulfobacteraceae bacterium IS3]
MYNKNVVNIMGKAVERIEYKGQPVITFRMVDELHERPDGTARNSFRRNKAQLIENEDFFDVPYEEWSEILDVRLAHDQRGGHRASMVFLTESGYLMIVKPFGDDLAWKIQRALVRNYFAAKEIFEEKSTGSPHDEFLLKQATHLLDIVCHELEQVRDERNDLRKRLMEIHDRLIAKGAVPSKIRVRETRAASSVPKQNEEILEEFVTAWWSEYGEDSVGVSHLYPLLKRLEIPLNITDSTERSRCIQLGRILTGMHNRQFGNYIVTTAKPYRNVKRYKLRLMPSSYHHDHRA